MVTNSVQSEVPRFRPDWADEIQTFHRGRIARQFILHFNLNDLVIDLSEMRQTPSGQWQRAGEVVGDFSTPPFLPPMLREYLHEFLFNELRCQAVYTYSLAGGLTGYDREQNGNDLFSAQKQQGAAIQRLATITRELGLAPARQSRNRGQQGEGQEISAPDLPNEMADTFKLLEHVLRQPYYDLSPEEIQNLQRSGRTPPEAPIAVILDYAEKLIPYHLGEGQGEREQLQALEVVQRWAPDRLIRQTRNIIILLTTNIGLIPPSVFAEGSGCRAIRVPLPDENERMAFIRFLMTRARQKLTSLDPQDFPGSQNIQAAKLARATQGMRLMDIDNISRRVYVEFYQKRTHDLRETMPVITMQKVQRAKSEVIEAQSAELLEVIRPERGFNEIGGLESLKDYLRQRTGLMSSRSQSPLVPNGLLLAGPPGTGKTIIAEALARESGFNLVKMRNIQDKWIGSSERNLEMVLSLLKDLHPVIVFIDEIDQAMVRRDTGQSGDSGVGARMFARILEAMSNPDNRGNILWVAATNRADLIDAALLRRFDRVIPLLTPDVEESCRIFAAMPATIMKQSGSAFHIAYGGDLQQSGHVDEQGRPGPLDEDLYKFRLIAERTAEIGITGAGIEIIVRRAIELVYETRLKDSSAARGTGSPQIELRHLVEAFEDFKPNYDRKTYDYQSLLALRACNFYSVIPPLPANGAYAGLRDAAGYIDTQRLAEAIQALERDGAQR
ncbi:MAG TPA: ATP-binding protein [Ktedonobacteraceae bacterium]|nr:ATP-binding protein [Ktedonobacteraceae bacterium]